MKALLFYITFIVFLLYWATTIAFTLPNNYINLSLDKENQVFQFLFFQRWGFFAPPPTFDERLYFTYVNNLNKKTDTYEVIEPLNKEKKIKAPFNSREDIVDYILSNSITGIQDVMHETRDIYEYEKFDTISEVLEDEIVIFNSDSAYYHYIDKLIPTTSYFNTLVNYSVIVAKRQGIDTKNSKVVITISKLYIPKFADRNNKARRKEEVQFKSQPISIN
jgi:hypothetical protein